jgi:hypothetical protein
MTNLVLAGSLLAVMAAVATLLFVLGCAALFNRQWQKGVLSIAASVASTVVLALSLTWAARSLISAEDWKNDIGPEGKARFLADSIAGLMDVTALGLPAGMLAGALLLWRRRVRARTR